MELENRILFAESRLIVSLVSKFFSIRRLICSSFCMVSLKILFWMIAFFSIKDTVFARLNFVNSCFFFFVSIVLSFIPFISVICLRLKKSEDFFFQFLLNFVSTFYKNCLHVWLLVGLCIIFSFHSLQRVVPFLCSLSFFQRQTFSFTASSTSLPDSLLLLFNLPLNVNHSKKDQLFFILMVQTEKFFFNKTVAKLTTFISLSLLLDTKWYFFYYQFFQNFS